MEEIKVGEYVRTKKRISKICKMNGSKKTAYYGRYLIEQGTVAKKDILKHSPNLIDVLEEEDLVEIEYYAPRYKKRKTRVFEVEYVGIGIATFYNAHMQLHIFDYKWSKNDEIYKPKIKSILTKEQYTANCYEVK